MAVVRRGGFWATESVIMRILGSESAKRDTFFLRAAVLAQVTAVAMFGLFATLAGYAQSRTQSAGPSPVYQYDVISVKPNTTGTQGGRSSMPDGFSMRGGTLAALIWSAYGLKYPEQQLISAPAWLASDKFDVDAKMESSVMDALQKMSQDERTAARQQMMQALLADRFKLVVHHETRELQVYTLLIAKGGVKMKEAKAGDTYPNGFKMPGGRGGGAGSMLFQMGPSGVMITAQADPIAQLIPTISREVGRIVLDQTGLTASYDFVFQYTPENFRPRTDLNEASNGSGMALPPDFGAISIFTAVQEQLGLKLESAKAPIDVIVIDHVERPSGN
jgi:uncharacterized protein (TIGR03435 family)